MPSPMPLGAPVWTDSLTSDLASDVEFYKQLFGWTAADAGEEFFHYHTFSLGTPSEDGSPVMGLSPTPPGSEPSPTWNLHFHVADVDDATARAQKLGGSLALEPMDVGDSVRFSMLLDPNGAAFGLVQPKGEDAGFRVFGELNTPSWVEYNYDGLPAEAMKYYADLLGWEVSVPPWEGEGNPRPYAVLRAAGSDREFGGCHAAEGFELEMPPQWSVMLSVADVDAVCTRARELGGSIAADPIDVPGLRIAGIAAPSGTVVGIMSDRPMAV